MSTLEFYKVTCLVTYTVKGVIRTLTLNQVRIDIFLEMLKEFSLNHLKGLSPPSSLSNLRIAVLHLRSAVDVAQPSIVAICARVSES